MIISFHEIGDKFSHALYIIEERVGKCHKMAVILFINKPLLLLFSKENE